MADDSFLLGGSNVFIIIFFCFVGFICISFVLYHAYYKIPNQQKKIEAAQKKSRPIHKIPKETISSSNASDTANENLIASNNNDYHLIESNINSAKMKAHKKNDLIRLTSSLSTQTGEIIGNLNQDRDNRKISLVSENSKESQKSDNPEAVKIIAPSKITKPTASSKAKIVKSEKKQVNIKLKKKENSESSD